jgi:hypothetical protein
VSILQAPPLRVPTVDPTFFLTREWRNFFLTLQNSTEASPQILQASTSTAQTAAIATTPLTLPAVSVGFYRLNVYLLVTAAAGVSGSAIITISWTDDGLTATKVIASPANTLGANSSLTFPVHVDNDSPITYAVAYASNPSNALTYNLGIIAEALA